MTQSFPLTNGEEIYLLTRDVEPPTLHLEYRFDGRLDEPRLRRAIQAALDAHPMFRARLAEPRSGLRPPRWEIDPGRPFPLPLETTRCEADADLDRFREALVSTPVDLAARPSLRVVLVRRPGGDSLFFRFHHAVTDGVGGFRFVLSVVRAYGGRPDPMPPLDPIAARDPASDLWPRPPGPKAVGAASRLKLRRGSVSTLAPEGTADAPGYRFQLVRVPHERRRLLDPQRFGPAVTLNDLLMAALHLAIEAWNTDRGRPTDCVAVFLPVSNRPPEYGGEVVGNLTAGGRVASTPAQRADLPTLVRDVADRRKALLAGSGFAAVQKTPPWVQRLLPLAVAGLRNPLVVAGLSRLLGDLRISAVLSCLGRVDDYCRDFGDGTDPGPPAEVWLSGPIQFPPGLTINTAVYRRDLFLSFRYRRALFDAEPAARFADLYVQQLDRLSRRLVAQDVHP